jgi:hypothetical protein
MGLVRMGSVSDDIVTRLRRWNDSMVSAHWEGCSNVHPVCQMALAADEIERLRAQVRRQALELMVCHSEQMGLYQSEPF